MPIHIGQLQTKQGKLFYLALSRTPGCGMDKVPSLRAHQKALLKVRLELKYQGKRPHVEAPYLLEYCKLLHLNIVIWLSNKEDFLRCTYSSGAHVNIFRHIYSRSVPLLQADELHSRVLLSLCSHQAESFEHLASWQTLWGSSGTLIWHPGWLMHENDTIRFTGNGMTDSISHRSMAASHQSIHCVKLSAPIHFPF